MFVRIGKSAVNLDRVEIIGNLEGDGHVTLRMESGTMFKVSSEDAKNIRSLLIDEDVELFDDDYKCDCDRCTDLKDALIDALLELEPQSDTIQ